MSEITVMTELLKPYTARVLVIDSIGEAWSLVLDDYHFRDHTPYEIEATHFANTNSVKTPEIIRSLYNSWWDSILFLGILEQKATFEAVMQERGTNLLGFQIERIPKFLATGYSPKEVASEFAAVMSPNQIIHHFWELTTWERWKTLAQNSGLLEYRCPYGYAIVPELDGTVGTYPVEFIRSLRADGELRGPNISILPKQVFAELDVIKDFEALLKQGPNQESELHDFLNRHPQLLYGAEYESHFSELYQKWLLDQHGKNQRLDFLLVPSRSLPGVLPKIIELKRDIPKILETSDHGGFVHKVLQAVNQVRDYKRLYQEERHRLDVKEETGIDLSHSRLAVLIGRFPDKNMIPLFQQRRTEMLDVEIVTYDELAMARKRMMIISSPRIERFL